MQKYANLVELEKCCQTHIFLQNFVLIQPRTSPLKICKNLLILLTLTPKPLSRPEGPAGRRSASRRPCCSRPVHQISFFKPFSEDSFQNQNTMDAGYKREGGLSIWSYLVFGKKNLAPGAGGCEEFRPQGTERTSIFSVLIVPYPGVGAWQLRNTFHQCISIVILFVSCGDSIESVSVHDRNEGRSP